MKKYISIALALMMLISSFAGFSVYAVETAENTAEAAPAEKPAEAAPEVKEGATLVLTPEMKDTFINTAKTMVADNESIEPQFTLITENDNMALYAITDNSEKRMGEVAVLDKASGYVWRSNPLGDEEDIIGKSSGHAFYRTKSQIAVSFTQGYNYFDANMYYESILSDKVRCEVEEDSVKFVFGFRDVEFVIPVRYSLEGDAFVAELLLNDEEAKLTYSRMGTIAVGHLGETVEQEVDYNITEIKLLPAFGATSYNESGYMFIPDGSGALIYMNNGRSNITQPYAAPVFGNYKESKSEDYNRKASDRYMLPVFGTVKDDGHALMGVVTENATVSFINAEVSGYETAYNKVYSSYLHKIIKGADKEGTAQPMSQELRDLEKNYKVKYYCLSGDDASYVGMAKRYRKYLVEEKGMKKADDYREGALLLDMYAGVEKKTSILGIPWSKFEVMTTYEDIRKISDDMTEAGIDNVIFRYNDWIKKSGRKKVQVKPNFEGSIGGRKGYIKTKDYLDSKNMSLYMNIDFINYSESGNGYSRLSDSVKYTSQAPAYQSSGISAHVNMGSRWCLLKAPLVKEAALKFADKCEKEKITSVSIENIGGTVYSDGANKNGHTRGDCTNQFAEILADYKEKELNVLTSEPSEYAAVYSDVLVDIPSKDTYVEIADEAVPFYQIAVRGYKTYTTENVNMSSNPKNVLLNAVESGSSLLYSLVAGETTGLKETYLKYLYSCNYSQWKDEIIEDYKAYSEVMKMVEGADIDNHEKIGEDVYKTTYNNGVVVYVNYSDEAYQTENGTVVNATGFKAERGE